MRANCRRTRGAFERALFKGALQTRSLIRFSSDRSSSYGDSGGALIYFPAYKPAKGYQIGVVSWGIECGSNRPGVYTRVLSHIDWINEQTKDAVRCH